MSSIDNNVLSYPETATTTAVPVFSKPQIKAARPIVTSVIDEPIIVTPDIFTSGMKKWMANRINPDNLVPKNIPSPVIYTTEEISLPSIEEDPFSAESLNKQLIETRKKIENDSPSDIDIFIKNDLTHTLYRLYLKIESLNEPGMTTEAFLSNAGYLIEHARALEGLEKIAQDKDLDFTQGEKDTSLTLIIDVNEISEEKDDEISEDKMDLDFTKGKNDLSQTSNIKSDKIPKQPARSPESIDLGKVPVLTDIITDPDEMDKIIKHSVRIQNAVGTFTGDKLALLRTDVLLPMYKQTLAELGAKHVNKTAIPYLSRIETEDLLRHADFLKGQIKIADKKIEAEVALKSQVQAETVITESVILNEPQLIQPQEKPQKSRLNSWFQDSCNAVANFGRKAAATAAIILGTAGAGSLAAAFSISAGNAPEAPEAPKTSPISIASVVSTPTTTTPALPVITEQVAPIVVAKPVKAKPTHLTNGIFAPAAKVASIRTNLIFLGDDYNQDGKIIDDEAFQDINSLEIK